MGKIKTEGNVIQTSDRNGREISFTYDNLNRNTNEIKNNDQSGEFEFEQKHPVEEAIEKAARERERILEDFIEQNQPLETTVKDNTIDPNNINKDQEIVEPGIEVETFPGSNDGSLDGQTDGFPGNTNTDVRDNVEEFPTGVNEDLEAPVLDHAAEDLPNLTGRTREEARKQLRNTGYEDRGFTPGGYEKWYHPDGSRVLIRPNGEVTRTGPKVKPADGGNTYRPSYGADGQRLRTPEEIHNTGENLID